MTREEIRSAVVKQLGDIAPESTTQAIPDNVDLREELDLDSMDFLNFVGAIDRELHVAIPESDYARIFTLRSCTDYLANRLGAAP